MLAVLYMTAYILLKDWVRKTLLKSVCIDRAPKRTQKIVNILRLD